MFVYQSRGGFVILEGGWKNYPIGRKVYILLFCAEHCQGIWTFLSNNRMDRIYAIVSQWNKAIKLYCKLLEKSSFLSFLLGQPINDEKVKINSLTFSTLCGVLDNWYSSKLGIKINKKLGINVISSLNVVNNISVKKVINFRH